MKVLFELSWLEDQDLGSSRDLTWHGVRADSREVGRVVSIVLVSNFESGDRRIETWCFENELHSARPFFLAETSVKRLCGLILSGRLLTLINGRAVAINKYYVTARNRAAPSL